MDATSPPAVRTAGNHCGSSPGVNLLGKLVARLTHWLGLTALTRPYRRSDQSPHELHP
jgi:hypothetical protein